MSTAFAKEALKISVAQICQNIGWHAVQTTPLDILVDVLQRYVSEIAKSVQHYSVQYNRTEVNLDDLGLAFQDLSILIHEIQEYATNVDSVPFPFKIVEFPVQKQSNLQIPKSDSRELLMRPEHIPSYLPPLHPDLEEESLYPQQSVIDGVKKNSDGIVNGCDSTSSPLSSPKHGLKRSDWNSDTFNRKSRYYVEEEGRPMREVTSVFMTPTGFVSPVHEGKCADATIPVLVDSPPPTPEPPPPIAVSSKKESKLKDVKKEKSKSKKDKELSKKDLKKLKSSKKEKENKDSSNKHEKLISLSTNPKKEHGSSHKSNKSVKVKSTDSSRPKKDKIKIKSRKDEAHRIKENYKIGKMKAKLKHSGASGSSHMKPMKLSSSKKLKAARLAKSIKHFKGEKTKVVEALVIPPPIPAPVLPVFHKEISSEPKIPAIEPVLEKEIKDEYFEDEDMDFREESPEPRLVIDDSFETQVRQERESRLEVIDECIEAVIRRGEEQSETEHKSMEDTINAVVRGPPMMMMRKLEPKDIYDFTDASDSSSLSSCDIPPHSPAHTLPKKEKKSAETNKKSSDSPKRGKKDKKKKGGKDSKAKSSSPYSPPSKNQKSNFILKVEERTPSPTFKDDFLSSDGSTPSSSPRSNSFFDHSPSPQGSTHQSPMLSHVPARPPPFVPGTSYASSPFAAVKPLGHIQPNPHFPTPPLFVTPGKAENGTSFQNFPLNLAKSGSSSNKNSPEKPFDFNASHTSSKETSDIIKKASVLDKGKIKDRKKDKGKKKGHKDTEKLKEKKEKDKEKEETKEKEVKKPKEKLFINKYKLEKNAKAEKRKSKLDKKKKDKEEKVKEDITVPKMTLKLASGSGSTKIFVKPNTKNSTSLSSSPSPTHDMEDDIPSLPPRVPTPSPPREPTPPPRRSPTPPPPPSPSPSPPPPVAKVIKEPTPPPPAPPPVTKPTHSRGRGRGRKAASAANPPARTVITETVGTIVDESGNKIWICPACSNPDDGSPMIGCDECDDWYHWVCVNIVVPPKEEENWFCDRCVKKRKTKPKEKRGRKKHKKDK